MRKSIALGTFAALAAGSVGAGALDSVPSMLGSDTLKDITTNIISSCTALGTYSTDNDASTAGVQPIVYAGTGSGNGESAMKPATPAQWVAPMSRALGTGICDAASPKAGAEGVVFALDGLSIVFGPQNLPGVDGIDWSGTTAGATANVWRTVLREVYTGLGASGSNVFARDCNSASRRAIINNWNSLFKNGTNGGGSCTTDSNPDASVTEAGLRHAFRRIEESGTTDVLLAQLSLPAINFQQASISTSTAIIPSGSSSTQAVIYRALANSTFCNVKRPEDTYGAVSKSGSVVPPFFNTGTPASIARAGATGLAPYDASLGDNARFIGPYFPETMDQDPVRRKCFGSKAPIRDAPNSLREEVCSADGFLGVVLPIEPPGGVSVAALYPTKQCEDTLDFQFGPAATRPTGDAVRCPNGDAPQDGQCFLPTRTEPTQPKGYAFDCLNHGALVPQAIYDQDGLNGHPGADFPDAPTTDGLGDADGRVYNLTLRKADGTIITHKRPNPSGLGDMVVPTINAFYRIHSSKGGTTVAKTCAAQDDATDQIGCLVQANPCSFGYAGGGAVSNNPGTVAALVNGVAPTPTTVQALIVGGTTYPIARKLYINSLRGFENLLASDAKDANKDAELDLVKCFSNLPFSTSAGFGTAINVASPFGFVPLPTPTTGGANRALCEDFIDSSCSGVTGNVDNCVGNPAGVPSSACDNGYKDGDETGVDACPAVRPTCNTTTHLCQ